MTQKPPHNNFFAAPLEFAKLERPHRGPDEAFNSLVSFYNDVLDARKKHRIPHLLILPTLFYRVSDGVTAASDIYVAGNPDLLIERVERLLEELKQRRSAEKENDD